MNKRTRVMLFRLTAVNCNLIRLKGSIVEVNVQRCFSYTNQSSKGQKMQVNKSWGTKRVLNVKCATF